MEEKLQTIASDIMKGLKSISRALHISMVRGAAMSIVETVSKNRLMPATNTKNVVKSAL